MALSSGSASYYMQGGGVSGSGAQFGMIHVPPGFRPLHNQGIPAQSNVRVSTVGPTFSVEPPHPNFTHGINMGVSPGVPSGEPIKKKRGRPRKYGPDGPVSLQLSPMSAAPNATPGSNSSSQKRARGRLPGTGRKQKLVDLGKFCFCFCFWCMLSLLCCHYLDHSLNSYSSVVESNLILIYCISIMINYYAYFFIAIELSNDTVLLE